MMALRHFVSSIRSQSHKCYHVGAAHWQKIPNKMTSLPKLNKNFRLVSAKDHTNSNSASRFTVENRPLVVLLTWINAKNKSVDRYNDIYLREGYDVLNVTIDGWQFLFPSQGAKVVAHDLLNYLYHFSLSGNQPLLLHGFSVGAYCWGEVLLHIKSDVNKYSELLKRVKGVIWDSPPDFRDTWTGLPIAVAPNNLPLRVLLQSYLALHLVLLYPISTRHYIAASKAFSYTVLPAPALMLVSRNDPIASVKSAENARKVLETLGIPATVKIWDKSKHVSHYMLYPEEYLAAINEFLVSINFPTLEKNQLKIQSKL